HTVRLPGICSPSPRDSPPWPSPSGAAATSPPARPRAASVLSEVLADRWPDDRMGREPAVGVRARESTTVVVVGAGAAGMTTAVLLRRCGINCVVLERQAREYVEQRQRAAIVEYRAARMFSEMGLDGLLGDSLQYHAGNQGRWRAPCA